MFFCEVMLILSLLLQIFVSKKWGFTKFDREVYEKMRSAGRLIPDGVICQYQREHGPLALWMKKQTKLQAQSA
jgi:large subunit ribosomal protein L10e